MKTTTLTIFIFLASICAGQTNKTLKDSVLNKGDIVKIPEIIFDINNRITESMKDSLNPIGEFLTRHKNLIVEIANYTDSRGNAEMNVKISNHRAQCVWNYLIDQFKLYTAFVKYKGYGGSNLIIPNAKIEKAKTKEEQEKMWAINRRTELIILDVK